MRSCLLEQHPDLDQRWANQPAGLTGLPQLVGREDLTDTQRLLLEEAYDRMAGSRYRISTDFMILFFTVLIVIRLKKPMSFEQALSLVSRHQPHHVHLPQQFTSAADADAVA